MNIQPIENSSPKIRSIRTLKQWIEDGRLRTGEQLPPDNELAQLLNVSRTTIRAAIKVVTQDGLLGYNESGRRIVVAPPAKKSRSLVSNTVVLLTHLTETAEDNSTGPASGWERHIQLTLIDAIREAGLHALTLQIDLVESNLVKTMIADPPHGLLIMRPSTHPSNSLNLAIALRDRGVPVVSYGFTDLAKFDTVASDSEAGSYELAKWLIKSGRRRILRVWTLPDNDEVPMWQQQRALGYERAIAESKLKALPILQIPDVKSNCTDRRIHFEMQARLTAGYLMDHLNGHPPVDAIMALSDRSCSIFAAACRLLGKEPNKDVAIAGYDNYWRDCIERRWESTPPIASVDKHNGQLGHELMALMQARTAHELPDEPQIRLIKPELVITSESDSIL